MKDGASSPNVVRTPRFYSVHAAARILGVSAMTLYREIHDGAFPAVRIRNRLIIPAKAVDDMAQAAIENHSTVDARDWATHDGQYQ
jgi:excisionase family DNA binding protein